jgi:serine/threonine-protein kinase
MSRVGARPATPTLIRRIDRYELLEPVGSGGMAVVYRGRDTALDREVAVKLLHPHLAARAESRARFSREARAVARLSHPNIVEIYDYAGDAALESYLVTEFVPGRTLRAFAEEEGIAFPEVGALLARALADALVHAHAAGVIHRDLKPENVLVLEAGGRRAVKLVDFGIARIVAADDRMTMTGALVGSPNHMAPEIIEGREADARSDLFSLGTLLYWLATGRMPFAAPNPTATLRRVIEGDYEDPRHASALVSDALAAVVAGALAADPERRTPTALALRDALDVALAGAGLADPAAELQAFLRDPAGYQRALRPRLSAAALAQADAALERGETARGMKLLDRVLALDPGDAAVAGRLRRIERSARLRRAARRVAAGALAVACAGALGWGGWRLVQRSASPGEGAAGAAERTASGGARPEARPSAPAGEAAPGAGASAPATAAPARAEAPAAGPRRAAAETDPGRPVAPAGGPAARHTEPAAAPQQLSVHVSPYAQRALLDGVEVARDEGRVAFTLAAGAPHRIQLEHACCFPYVREFAPGERVPPELKARLQPRPARLRVEAEPGARVYVGAALVGTAGESQRAPLEVPVPAGGESPYEATVEVRVEAEGRPPRRAAVKLRAGADVTVAATPSAPPAARPAEEDAP